MLNKKIHRLMRSIFFITIILSVILAFPSLKSRVSIEQNNRTIAICMDYRDFLTLSKQGERSPDLLIKQFALIGLSGMAVAELTGKDLSAGALSVQYGTTMHFTTFHPELRQYPKDNAVIIGERQDPIMQKLLFYVKIKFPRTVELNLQDKKLLILPFSTEDLAESAFVPDFKALDYTKYYHIRALFRPSYCIGTNSQRTAEALHWLNIQYPNIAALIPAGQIIMGYPDLSPITSTIKKLNIPVAQVEFIRQIGGDVLVKNVSPAILPLHSLVRDELLSRRMSRTQIIERMVRAAHERSIRILFMRPYEIYTGNKLPSFIEDITILKNALINRGYTIGWPSPLPFFPRDPLSSFSITLIFLSCLYSYSLRFTQRDLEYRKIKRDITLLVFCFCTIIAAIFYFPPAARYIGGFTAAIVATEAALCALDPQNGRLSRYLGSLFIAIAGGLTIAAFYGIQPYMLRLDTFSGVKLTLLLPLLLLLIHDLHNRVHPESIKEILSRPPIWGELFLCAALFVAAILLTLRSDNVNSVPGWEIHFRELLERILLVRPRTKEFLIGYPCLVIYWALMKNNSWIHYREVLRLGTCIAFSSAVNTFCHFHTLLSLTLIRVFNGWWLGLALGFIIVFTFTKLLSPIWKHNVRNTCR